MLAIGLMEAGKRRHMASRTLKRFSAPKGPLSSVCFGPVSGFGAALSQTPDIPASHFDSEANTRIVKSGHAIVTSFQHPMISAKSLKTHLL